MSTEIIATTGSRTTVRKPVSKPRIPKILDDLSTVTESDYKKSLAAVKRQMYLMRVSSIGCLDAHDIAIEAVMNAKKWGGMSFVPRRAKLLVIEKMRNHTGLRRSKSKGPQEVKMDRLDFFAKPHSDEKRDLEELLHVLSIPEKLRNMVRMKVLQGMRNKEISAIMGVKESEISRFFGEWAHPVKEMLENRAAKQGIRINAKIRNRSKNYDRSKKQKDNSEVIA